MTELIQIKKKKETETPKDQLIIKINRIDNTLDMKFIVEITYKGITTINTVTGFGVKVLIDEFLNKYFMGD